MIRGDLTEQALYARAAAFVRARKIESDADLGPLFDTPPAEFDADVLRRLRQMYEAGGWVLVESAIADLPSDLRWLYESGAVTIEQLAVLHHSLGATSATDLATAVHEQQIRGLPGFDADIEAAVGAALPALRARVARVPLGRATAAAEVLLERLQGAPGVEWTSPSGSLRRGQDMVGDIELVAATDRPADAAAALLDTQESIRVLHQSERRLYLLIDRMQIGIRLPAPANAGATLLHLTGSWGHFEALRAHATSVGWQLTPDGLRSPDGAFQPSSTEEAIYDALGLPFIVPEIREGGEAIERARAGTLPTLVAATDIRGDLHMHSLWSDGRDPIESMVQACRDLGYEYMAITDHSPHSAAVRNLTVDGVQQQADEIAGLRERYPEIAILHGCEVDILPDGRLDFPDKILQQFDIVLASLHEGAGHSPQQLMQRYVAAMKHPLVTLITHPTNRMLPHKRGYDLDYDQLFALAVEHRTVVEIDGAPGHLDLDGALARRAIAAGATVAIDSDCHRAEMLGRQMQFGLSMARRGWVEPRHVLNARPLADVRALIAAKRGAS